MDGARTPGFFFPDSGRGVGSSGRVRAIGAGSPDDWVLSLTLSRGVLGGKQGWRPGHLSSFPDAGKGSGVLGVRTES